jgi:hypothetical protein
VGTDQRRTLLLVNRIIRVSMMVSETNPQCMPGGGDAAKQIRIFAINMAQIGKGLRARRGAISPELTFILVDLMTIFRKQPSLSALLTVVILTQWSASTRAQQPEFDIDGPAVFTPLGTELHMNGSIFPQTVSHFHAATLGKSQLKTLVLHDIPGSVDDDAALRLYRAIRQRGLNTHVPADGVVSSGGVDLFCAGVHRTAESGSLLLVHPWEDDRLGRGDQVPLSNPIHDFYRNYYAEMGIGKGFYELTLFAPPTTGLRGKTGYSDMYNLTTSDRVRFRIVTTARNRHRWRQAVTKPDRPPEAAN